MGGSFLLKLKDDVKNKIIKSLCNGDCESVSNILDNINRSYLNINGYLKPSGGFASVIYIPEQCIRGSSKCSPGGSLDVNIVLFVSINEYYWDGIELLDDYDVEDEFIDDEVSMRFISKDISKIEELVLDIMNRDVLFWSPGADFDLDRDYDRVKTILYGGERGLYKVKLGNEYEPKMKIIRIYVSYRGEIASDNVALYIRSNIYENNSERSMSEWSNEIEKIKRIIDEFGDVVKPNISLKLSFYEY